MKTIYNTFVIMESQEQCDRMKQLCIDNRLPYWKDYSDAFHYVDKYDVFSYASDSNMFFILASKEGVPESTEITEQEFIELLKQSK